MNTEEKLQYIFNAIAAAGVQKNNFAKLAQVSRATIHNWKNRESVVVDELRLNVAIGVAKRLNAAVAAGKLPMSPTTKPQERYGILLNIVRNIGNG